VLCADESPVNVLENDLDEDGEQVAGAPHAVAVRPPDARLIYYAGMTSRSKPSIADLGVLEGWHGYLVRDDYAGRHQFDPHLAGVQQCAAHLIGHFKGRTRAAPGLAEMGRPGHHRTAQDRESRRRGPRRRRRPPRPRPPRRPARTLRQGRRLGITTNRHRNWHTGNHPGYTLAQRLKNKAEQVWLFARNFKIPWTNNASEQALKSPKRHQAVSGYRHSTNTLRADLRIRSYLTSARGHGIRAIDAIHAALTGNPWLPVPRHSLTTPTRSPVNGHQQTDQQNPPRR
jgi:hypothetical protein